ncbi:MAG: SDR family NAD(P)-dependent oxidoreductase [Alcanivorax sp.]
MTDSPVLVTGAAGFIGFHTAKKLLDDGRHVVGIDNINDYYDVELKKSRLAILEEYDHFAFVKLDIADKDGMEKLFAEQGPFLEVIHLAAQAGVRYSLQNPYSYIHSNCMGHLTVLEMCRHTDGFKHLVYASSSSVYGGNDKLPYSTADQVNTPVSLYAATKRSDELMSHTYSHLYDIKQTGLRFFTVYGPWGRPDMSPHIFTKAIIAGDKVPVFNNGNMKRDFTFVDDIVEGVLGALDNPPEREGKKAPHRVLNIGNSKSEKLMDFIDTIQSAIGKDADIEFFPMQPGDVHETYADTAETARITGFKAKTSISEGIPRFVEWYKEYYKVDL